MALREYQLDEIQLLREKELKQLEVGIRRQEYFAVSSPPQSGLTMFFRQAAHHIKSVPDISDYIPVLVKENQWQESLNLFFAQQVANVLLGEVKNPKVRLKRFAKLEQKGLDDLFRSAFGNSPKNVVFFIDNFHVFGVEQQREFVTHLRKLHTYRTNSEYIPRMLFVVGGCVHWQQIDPNKTSPFSNAASKIVLEDFRQEESLDLIHRIFRRQGCRISDATCCYIYEITRGHPYFIKVLPNIISRNMPHEVKFVHVDNALRDLLMEGDYHLKELRNKIITFEKKEVEPLFAILRGQVVRRSLMSPNPTLDKLHVMGVLSCSRDNQLQIRNLIYSRFLRTDPVIREHFHDEVLVADNEISYPLLSANREGYEIVHVLEIHLRNFIAHQLQKHYGENWLELGLEGISTDPERDNKKNKSERDLLLVLQLRREKEKSDLSIPYVESPTLSYAMLKELENILMRNWKSVFKNTVRSQDRLKVYLTILNRIRNKLAHNRCITDVELDKLQEMQVSFRSWLGYC